jgi:ParB family transcriptional regulator, chromosome partitioning protein
VSQDKQSQKKRGLGKGFETLLPQDFDSSLLIDPSERIQKLHVSELMPNPEQPRRHFDELSLQQLAESIAQYGMLQPLIVTPRGTGQYQIIAGERRWRAAQKAKLTSVPAIVRTAKDLELLELALVENVQRVDLSPLEQAVSIERLHQQFNLTYDVIAKRLNKAVSTVNNIVRLLQLPKDVMEALRNQHITEGHARSILSLKDYPNKQSELLRLIIEHGWSVRQAERFVVAFKHSRPDSSASSLRKKISSETVETKQLSKKIASPITIRHMAHGGKLEIGFKSDDDLRRLIQLLMSLTK